MNNCADFAPISIAYEITVPFYDVDSMNIVWHGNYVKYFEDARCALLNAMDYDYDTMRATGYGYPVIDMRIQYAKPLFFRQVVVVEATLKDIENGLLIHYKIKDKKSGKRLSKGYTRQVAVDMHSEEMLFNSPNIVWEKVRAYWDKLEE